MDIIIVDYRIDFSMSALFFVGDPSLLTPSAHQPLGKRYDFLGTSKESRIRKYREFVETYFPKFFEMCALSYLCS